jgi:pimeloyl-ACP methyl ester carboxylesterase
VGSLRPDAFVGVAAASDLLTAQQTGPDWVREFLGGDRVARPEAWAAADPFTLATRHPTEDGAVPILLIHGANDGAVDPATSSALDATLRAAGYQSRLVIVPSADHGSILAARETVEAIMGLANDK